MTKDRKTLTDAEIVSRRTPGRRPGHTADADGALAQADRDAGKPAATDAAKDHGPVKDHDQVKDHDRAS